MRSVKLVDSEFTRNDWLKMGSLYQRQAMAKQNALAWVMEYQPLIRLENKGDLPLQPYWSQQNWLEDDSQFRILNKTRQSGYTTTAGAGEIPHDMIHKTNQTIIVLSKSETEATNLMDKFYLAYDSVEGKDPDWSPYVKRNTGYCLLENGNKFRVLTSSKGSGRSFTASHLYMDEAAHIQYMRQIYEGSYPTIARSGGRISIFSTPESGTKFQEICENAEDMGYSFHQYEWWFVPEYNPYYKEFISAYLRGDTRQAKEYIEKARHGEWYRKAYAALGEMSFLKEFECAFDAGGDFVFTTKQLNTTFYTNDLVRDEDGYGEVWQKKDVFTGYSEHTVITDYGRKRDPTVIAVYAFHDASGKWDLVRYQRIRPSIFDWGQVIGAIMWHYKHFNEPDMYHDGTGSGDALTMELAGYSIAIQMTDNIGSKVKSNAIENTRRALDNEVIMLPKIEQLYREMKGYKWSDKSVVQDSVMTLVMFLMKKYDASDTFIGIDRNFSFVGA